MAQRHPTGEITPDTHVRMSLNKLVAIVGAVIVGVFIAAVAWTGVQRAIERLGADLAVHMADKDRHLDPDYQKDHGRPVGRFDINAWQAQNTRALEDLQVAVKNLQTELVKRRH